MSYNSSWCVNAEFNLFTAFCKFCLPRYADSLACELWLPLADISIELKSLLNEFNILLVETQSLEIFSLNLLLLFACLTGVTVITRKLVNQPTPANTIKLITLVAKKVEGINAEPTIPNAKTVIVSSAECLPKKLLTLLYFPAAFDSAGVNFALCEAFSLPAAGVGVAPGFVFVFCGCPPLLVWEVVWACSLLVACSGCVLFVVCCDWELLLSSTTCSLLGAVPLLSVPLLSVPFVVFSSGISSLFVVTLLFLYGFKSIPCETA